MNQIEIGRFISHLRRERKLTQKEIADKLGVTYQAVSKWERGENLPDVLTLKKLADIYGVSVDYILSCEYNQSDLDSDIGINIDDNFVKDIIKCNRNKSWKKKLSSSFLIAFFITIPAIFMYFMNFGNNKLIAFFLISALIVFVVSFFED